MVLGISRGFLDKILLPSGESKTTVNREELTFLREDLYTIQEQFGHNPPPHYQLPGTRYSVGYGRQTGRIWLNRNGRKVSVNAMSEGEEVLWRMLHKDIQYLRGDAVTH